MTTKEIIFAVNDVPNDSVYDTAYETIRKMGGVISIDIFRKSGVIKVIYDTASTTSDKISRRLSSIVPSIEMCLERFCGLKKIEEDKPTFNFLRLFIFSIVLIIFCFSKQFETNIYILSLIYLFASLWFLCDLKRASYVNKKSFIIYPLTSLWIVFSVLYTILKIFFPLYFPFNFIDFYSSFIFLFFIAIGFDLSNYLHFKDSISLASFSYPMQVFLRVIKDGIEMHIPSTDLKKGDIVVLSSGDFVCFDGCVIDGSATVDESLIKNSDHYTNKKSGDKVISGSFIVDGGIKLIVENEPKDSFFYGGIRRMMFQNKAAKGFEDRIYKASEKYIRFIPLLALFFAALSYFGRIRLSTIESFFIIFFISYPYALWIIFPSAYFILSSLGVKKGFLIKNIDLLETINYADTVVFFSSDGIVKDELLTLKASGLKTLLACDKNFSMSCLSAHEKLGFILRLKISGSRIIGIGSSADDFEALAECDVRVIVKKHPESFSFPCDVVFMRNDPRIVKELKRYASFILNVTSQSSAIICFIHLFILPILFAFLCRYFYCLQKGHFISVLFLTILIAVFNSLRLYFLKSS